LFVIAVSTSSSKRSAAGADRLYDLRVVVLVRELARLSVVQVERPREAVVLELVVGARTAERRSKVAPPLL